MKVYVVQDDSKASYDAGGVFNSVHGTLEEAHKEIWPFGLSSNPYSISHYVIQEEEIALPPFYVVIDRKNSTCTGVYASRELAQSAHPSVEFDQDGTSHRILNGIRIDDELQIEEYEVL